MTDMTAKLGDMNVSKLVESRELNHTQTGTPYYASPEVWNDKPYDQKSDVWSLGCVIYEMCALVPPFKAESMEKLYEKICVGKYAIIPERYSLNLSIIISFML